MKKRNLIARMPLALQLIIIALLCCVLSAILLLMAGHRDAAWAVGNGGPFLVFAGAFAYIAAIDSKKRWPNTALSVRVYRFLTFYRGK